jgi:tetratricopeptide (TPR) repeat protein
MPRILAALSALLLVASPAAAQDVDKDKLRRAVEPPSFSGQVEAGTGSTPDPKKEKLPDREGQARKLESLLDGSRQDAEKLLQVCNLYFESKNFQKFEETRKRMAALLEKYLNTKDPSEGHLLSLYGNTLKRASPTDWDGYEKWSRRAVEVAPQDWRCWCYLGECLWLRAHTLVVLDPAETVLSLAAAHPTLTGGARNSPPDRGAVERAEKLLDEARRCFERARQVSPQVARCQGACCSFWGEEINLRNLLSQLKGQPLPYPHGPFDQRLFEEHKRLARLLPDDVEAQFEAIHFGAGIRVIANQPKNAAAPAPDASVGFSAKSFSGTVTSAADLHPLLDAKQRKEFEADVREFLDNLERLAQKGGPADRLRVHEWLATLFYLLRDLSAVERHSEQVLRLDPGHTNAAMLYAWALEKQGRLKESVAALRKLATATPGPVPQYLLARSLVKDNRWEEAEKELRAGLKFDPSHSYCLVGLAAALVRRSGGADTLAEAGRLLADARVALKPSDPQELVIGYELVAAAHQALSGDLTFAMLKLERLRQDCPDDEGVKKALAAFGR